MRPLLIRLSNQTRMPPRSFPSVRATALIGSSLERLAQPIHLSGTTSPYARDVCLENKVLATTMTQALSVKEMGHVGRWYGRSAARRARRKGRGREST